MFRHDGMRNEKHSVVVLKTVLQDFHVFGHLWADGWTSDKKEIRNINFIFEYFRSHRVAFLVGKVKIANGVNGFGFCQRVGLPNRD